jgi:hypothetical protein
VPGLRHPLAVRLVPSKNCSPRQLRGGEGKPDLGGRQNPRSNVILIEHETPAMIVPGA